jgi:hypothetical protein
MNLNESFKVFELNLLRQSGVMVTPQQVGLKSDPIAALQAKNATGMFGNVLNQLNGGSNLASNTALSTAMTPPVPPTPPADPANAAAQAKYQQELLAYQSNFQIYNQRFMQLLLNQMSNIQMSIRASAAQANNNANNNNSSSSSSDLGIGGIL